LHQTSFQRSLNMLETPSMHWATPFNLGRSNHVECFYWQLWKHHPCQLLLKVFIKTWSRTLSKPHQGLYQNLIKDFIKTRSTTWTKPDIVAQCIESCPFVYSSGCSHGPVPDSRGRELCRQAAPSRTHPWLWPHSQETSLYTSYR